MDLNEGLEFRQAKMAENGGAGLVVARFVLLGFAAARFVGDFGFPIRAF